MENLWELILAWNIIDHLDIILPIALGIFIGLVLFGLVKVLVVGLTNIVGFLVVGPVRIIKWGFSSPKSEDDKAKNLKR